MPYDRDSFLAGLAVGRTLWRPHRVSGKVPHGYRIPVIPKGDPSWEWPSNIGTPSYWVSHGALQWSSVDLYEDPLYPGQYIMLWEPLTVFCFFVSGSPSHFYVVAVAPIGNMDASKGMCFAPVYDREDRFGITFAFDCGSYDPDTGLYYEDVRTWLDTVIPSSTDVPIYSSLREGLDAIVG